MRATATAGVAARARFAFDKTALARTAGARMEPIFTMLRRVRWALTLKSSRSPATMLTPTVRQSTDVIRMPFLQFSQGASPRLFGLRLSVLIYEVERLPRRKSRIA